MLLAIQKQLLSLLAALILGLSLTLTLLWILPHAGSAHAANPKNAPVQRTVSPVPSEELEAPVQVQTDGLLFPTDTTQMGVAARDETLPQGVSQEWWATVQAQLYHYNYSPTLDPLVTPAVFTATGENDGDHFGLSLDWAGDVNGDGYADIVVGANDYMSKTGKMYMYYGSDSGLSSSPAFTATGENEGDGFGISVAAAGDVNGDGFADVIVGAYEFMSDTGKVYVYHGSDTGLSSSPAFMATGENEGDRLGFASSSAGDVNGDGYADVIVGTLNSDTFNKVYVYHGSSTGLNSSPASSATGENEDDRFGQSLASAGDVNGDGYADVIIGAWNHAITGTTSFGKAYVYHGSDSGLSADPAFTAVAESFDALGTSVAAAGDVNGDGYGDVVIGSPFTGPAQGKISVYHGSANGLSASPAFTDTGKNFNDSLGFSAASAGDINGDGYADVIAGADRSNFVNVYLGSDSGLSASAIFSVTGEAEGGNFGRTVSSAGDVNGDGFSDVMIGAWLYPDYDGRGRVYVYQGQNTSLNSLPALTATGETEGDMFGISVASAGDVNGDGYADVVVGAPSLSMTGTGKVYVYHGSSNGPGNAPAFTMTGENNFDNFGVSVASAGDVNGDGFADVIVGALGYPAGDRAGKAYVYHGSDSGLNSVPAFTVMGQNNGDFLGLTVNSAGDVNGDGFADVIIGASYFSTGTGKAYVYHGSDSGLISNPAFTATGENKGDKFGQSAASVGDINGDGFADVIIGAWSYPSGAGQGKVYVYYGSDNGLSSNPDFTITGEENYSSFGAAVASAGDVNGDGFADVVVGALDFGSAQGKVYVYHGSNSGPISNPAFTATGENNGDKLGFSVASAGDVNGDGFADVVVGVYGQGNVNVYHGSGDGLSGGSTVSLNGADANANLGYSVASSGDMNGDGFADIVAGDFIEGEIYMYWGGGGNGRPVLAHQRRGDGSVPVQAWGLSHNNSAFQARLTATSPRGRERVKLEVEACVAGVAFGAAGCNRYSSTTWSDVTTTSDGVVLTVPVDNLAANTLYRWRTRVLYAPYTVDQNGIIDPPNPVHGPWRRLNGQAVEADVRIAVDTHTVFLSTIFKN